MTKRIMSMVWVPQLSRPSATFDQRCVTWPIAPSATRSRAMFQPGRNRRWWPIASLTLLRCAATIICSASPRLVAIGFSQMMSFGWRAATAMTVEACCPCQRQTETMSGRSSSTISRKSAYRAFSGTPNSSPNSSRASGVMSASATSSVRSVLVQP